MKVIVIAFVASVCLALPVAAANNPVGLNVHLQQRFASSDWTAALDLLDTNGISWAREEFNWNTIEPSDNNFDFSAYDAVVDAYSERDIQAVGLLTYSSSWAASSEFAAPDIAAWKNYVKTVTKRYAGQVDYWEIWNEPNHDGFFTGSTAEYAEMLQAAAAEIRRVNPDAKVVLGGLSGADSSFLYDLCTELGGAAAFDIAAVHPYRQVDGQFIYAPEASRAGLNTLISDLQNVERAVHSCWDANTPIWLTEFGYPTKDTGATGVSRATQRNFLLRAITQALSVRGVKKVFVYELRDSGTDATNSEHHFGVVDREFTDKGALAGLGWLNQRLHRAQFVSRHATPSGFSAQPAENWSVSETTNTALAIQTNRRTVTLQYDFLSTDNSFALAQAPLPANSGRTLFAFQARATGSTPEILRLRIEDAGGEIYQYTLGQMPTTWAKQFVRLTADYATHWNGDGNGQVDLPITAMWFVLDNDDSAAQGNGTIQIRDVQFLRYPKYIGYRFTKSGKNRFVVWATKKTTLQFRSSKAGTHKIMKLSGTTSPKRKKIAPLTVRNLPFIIVAPK